MLHMLPVLAVASSQCAMGAIVYHDIPDIAVHAVPGPPFRVDLDLDGVSGADVSITGIDTSPGGGPWLMADILQPGGEVYVDPAIVTAFGPSYYARQFAPGALIGDVGDLRQSAGLFVEAGPGQSAGRWLTPGAKFMGVKFNSPSGEMRAWIRISRAAGPGGQIAIIHDYAYEDQVGTLIAAGAVPGVGSWAIVWAGLVGWSRRGRRTA